MNTYELTTLTLLNTNNTEASRQRLSPLFMASYNEAYPLMCVDMHLTAWEQVQLDSDNQFYRSDLPKPLRDILKVAQEQDYVAGAGLQRPIPIIRQDEGAFLVVTPPPSGFVWVNYEYSPPTLTQATDANDRTPSAIPSLIPDAYHNALASYAAAQLWATRNRADRMSVWMDRFYNIVESMKPPKDTTTNKIRNKFPAQPF